MFKVMKIFRGDNVRKVCIEKDWYTCGTCEQYDRLLRAAYLVQGEDLKHIESLARDIYSHSDVETMYGDESENAVVAMIMGTLIDRCVENYVVEV